VNGPRPPVSPKTVRNHISSDFIKLRVADRAQTIVRAPARPAWGKTVHRRTPGSRRRNVALPCDPLVGRISPCVGGEAYVPICFAVARRHLIGTRKGRTARAAPRGKAAHTLRGGQRPVKRDLVGENPDGRRPATRDAQATIRASGSRGRSTYADRGGHDGLT
jgi:hypothetical protein